MLWFQEISPPFSTGVEKVVLMRTSKKTNKFDMRRFIYPTLTWKSQQQQLTRNSKGTKHSFGDSRGEIYTKKSNNLYKKVGSKLLKISAPFCHRHPP